MLRIFLFNLSGRLVPLAISLIAFPIFVRQLGVASYGIIGIYNSFAALAGIVDIAFSNTINRELARRVELAADPSDTGAVFRTLELLAWMTGVVVAALLIVGAGPLVHGWIGVAKFSDHDLVRTIRLMGCLLLFQAPLSFYGGCLYGLHRHDLTNGISVVGGVASTALALFTVLRLSPTVEAFLIAQLVGRVLIVLSMAISSYILVARDIGWNKFGSSLDVLRRIWRFALGMNGIGALGLLGNQTDMMVLSRVLPANALGYYTIARTISQTLVALAMPAYQSAFPQLSKLVAARARSEISLAFRRFCQYLALVLVPTCVVIIVFSREVLTLWTGNTALGDNAWRTCSLLVVGAMTYGLNVMFSAVQMANGALRLLLLLGVLFVSLMVPAQAAMAHFHGVDGAATAWAVVNFVVLMVSAIVTMKRFMPSELPGWLAYAFLLPCATSLVPSMLCKLVLGHGAASTRALIAVGAASSFSVVFTALALPEGRRLVTLGLANVLGR